MMAMAACRTIVFWTPGDTPVPNLLRNQRQALSSSRFVPTSALRHLISYEAAGKGNIGHDTHDYVDGGIHREGVVGDSREADYSTGRGGAGNIASPQVKAAEGSGGSTDVIPDVDVREGHENFHTGRGGGGNVHKEKYGGHTHDPNRETLLDKAKQLVMGEKREKSKTPEPETTKS
ncbi:hypothetical protein K402DRAFT_10623 [Aulographum hederae CBS 113979]|uniref:Uncharacterized protein n=1 Tax=Aulographum hederae CBS 113979 TaxID=1176131 RepID=A0A6G1HHB5_9PEZI|nr:hypothetical protein K402DRAFT_10623 [Aulographum hederae CBS 113979]